MSANAVRMPEINIEEFERRLRAAGAGADTVEDPLEELTRLVGSISSQRGRGETAPAAAAPLGSSLENVTPLRPGFDESAASAEPIPEFEAPLPAREPTGAPPPAAAQPRRLSWYFKIGGLGVAAAALLAGAVILKTGGAPTGPRTPPMILAASGPDKIAPPDEKAVQSPSDTGALLNKDSAINGPVKVVDNREQPIDPTTAARPTPSPTAAQTPSVAKSPLPPADSPVAATMNTPILATSSEPAPPAAPIFARKKPLRTVAVRPDGSLIAVDSAPSDSASTPPTPAPSPVKPAAAPTVASQPASPTLDLPSPKPTKPAGRLPVAKTDTTAPSEPVNGPMQLGSGPEKAAKPSTKLRTPEVAAEATTAAEPPPAPAAGSGDYTVQLAAPRSEADARNAIQRLQTKYSDALGDASLGVRKAEKEGETIYRVRTSGMSKADASALCQKLKSDGGDCFVTKN